jgi:predicted transcriptional regulator
VVRVDHEERAELGDLLQNVAHPMRIAILQHVDEVGEVSPRAFTRTHRATLATVSHHFRMLARAGLIQLLRTEPRRGAVEHCYVLSDRGQAVLGWMRTASRRSDAMS